ncbi:MAG: hypothetical protein AVDCRST_MAG68-2915, partial [uncultured Gemmatimonadetes bacterium]
ARPAGPDRTVAVPGHAHHVRRERGGGGERGGVHRRRHRDPAASQRPAARGRGEGGRHRHRHRAHPAPDQEPAADGGAERGHPAGRAHRERRGHPPRGVRGHRFREPAAGEHAGRAFRVRQRRAAGPQPAARAPARAGGAGGEAGGARRARDGRAGGGGDVRRGGGLRGRVLPAPGVREPGAQRPRGHVRPGRPPPLHPRGVGGRLGRGARGRQRPGDHGREPGADLPALRFHQGKGDGPGPRHLPRDRGGPRRPPGSGIHPWPGRHLHRPPPPLRRIRPGAQPPPGSLGL